MRADYNGEVLDLDLTDCPISRRESMCHGSDRRVPDADRLVWAREKIASMGEQTTPKSRPEVYALKQKRSI